MKTPPKTIRDYKNSDEQVQLMRHAVNWFRSKGLYPR
jgi:hypothetical protein